MSQSVPGHLPGSQSPSLLYSAASTANQITAQPQPACTARYDLHTPAPRDNDITVQQPHREPEWRPHDPHQVIHSPITHIHIQRNGRGMENDILLIPQSAIQHSEPFYRKPKQSGNHLMAASANSVIVLSVVFVY